MRRFLMNIKGLSEDEAIALMSAAVDFGVTQVVDGNWGVHAILSKRLFEMTSRRFELAEAVAVEIPHDRRRAETGRAVQPCRRNRRFCLCHRTDAGYAGGAGRVAGRHRRARPGR